MEESMARKINPEDMVTVRTTMRPNEDLEVSKREAEDLRRQGLLTGDNQPEPEGQPETLTEASEPGAPLPRRVPTHNSQSSREG